MPRVPRKYLLSPGLALHKTWRGHNKEFNLNSESEKQSYLKFMHQEIQKQSNPIHAICLMSNHSHEIYTLGHHPGDLIELCNFFRRHHSRYGQFFNKKHNRCGKVAQDRPFTGSIEPDDYSEMEVTFYVHANPLRAGLCKDAKDYLYSTHKLYAFGTREPWMKHITFPSWYMKLGKTMKLRQKRYRQLFDAYLRERGYIKIQHSHYGYGSLLWKLQRREGILGMLKSSANSNAPPPH